MARTPPAPAPPPTPARAYIVMHTSAPKLFFLPHTRKKPGMSKCRAVSQWGWGEDCELGWEWGEFPF